MGKGSKLANITFAFLFLFSVLFSTHAEAYVLAHETFNKGTISSKWMIEDYAKGVTLKFRNGRMVLEGTIQPKQGNASSYFVSFRGSLKKAVFSLSAVMRCQTQTPVQPPGKEKGVSGAKGTAQTAHPPAGLAGFFDPDTTRGVGFWLEGNELFAVANTEQNKGDQKKKIKTIPLNKWIQVRVRYNDLAQTAGLFANNQPVASFSGLGLGQMPMAFVGVAGVEGEKDVPVSCQFDDLKLSSP